MVVTYRHFDGWYGVNIVDVYVLYDTSAYLLDTYCIFCDIGGCYQWKGVAVMRYLIDVTVPALTT